MLGEKEIRGGIGIVRCFFSGDELDINLILRNELGVDMLRPYSRQVGVLAGDVARVSEVINLDDVADNMN